MLGSILCLQALFWVLRVEVVVTGLKSNLEMLIGSIKFIFEIFQEDILLLDLKFEGSGPPLKSKRAKIPLTRGPTFPCLC